MDINDVKTFLAENAETQEVKDFLVGLVPLEGPKEISLEDLVAKKDLIEKWIDESEDGKKWMQSKTDQRVTSAIKTNTQKLRTEIENELREKLMPNETPEQIAAKKMQEQLNKMQADLKNEKLENFAIKTASSFGLELGDKVSLFTAGRQTEDEVIEGLRYLKDFKQMSFEEGRNSYLKNNSYTPRGGDDVEKLPFASLAEYGQYIKKNPGEYNQELYAKIAAREQKIGG